MTAPDAVIVGAGIVGAAVAEALARQGLRVRVLESAFPAGGATASAMGHVVVLDDSQAQLALTRRSRERWAELLDEVPAGDPERCEDRRAGTLWVAAGQEELAGVGPRVERYRRAGVAAEALDARQLADAEPRLRPGLAGGMRVPDDRIVYPPGVARWLLSRARARGAEVQSGTEVVEIGPRRVRTREGWTEAGAVVLCAGLASARLVPGLPLLPRRGHLVVTERAPGLVRHQLVELGYLASAHGRAGQSVAMNVQPRATGQLLVGSSRELGATGTAQNVALRDRMLRRAIGFLPALAAVPALRCWTGLRPCTPDNLPLIGRWEAVDGLWVATGHEGLGITTAPGTAELICDLVCGRSGALDPRPFAPQRSAPAHV